MINVREMRPDDIDKIRELYQRFFSDLEFPDFAHFLCAFTITDENDGIIMAGGLRPAAEIFLITDKTKSEFQLGKALIEAQKASLYIGQKFGIDELLAFVKDNDVYERHLRRHGFYSRSNALALRVPKWDSHNETKI